tara:strand:+ start:1430 stop:1810 length:381 start_codon:yes stop_codon:yes gene_type:complete
MAFKLNFPEFNNSDQENTNEVISSMNILVKELDEGIHAEADKSGVTNVDVDVDLHSLEGKKSLAHEQIHHEQMQEGELDYDNDFVFWKGTLFPRKTMNEGSDGLGWEWDAYNKEEDMFDSMFTKNT